MLQVAEGHRVPGDPDVGGVHPGPVVEPGRHPAPAEIPPVADAPGMVTLAVPFDGEHLVAHAHRAPDQTGHLVPGGDVVVVRHAIGAPAEVEPDTGGAVSYTHLTLPTKRIV